jgi:hypothetical protein
MVGKSVWDAVRDNTWLVIVARQAGDWIWAAIPKRAKRLPNSECSGPIPCVVYQMYNCMHPVRSRDVQLDAESKNIALRSRTAIRYAYNMRPCSFQCQIHVHASFQ